MSAYKKEAARRRRRIIKLLTTTTHSQSEIGRRCQVSQQYVNKVQHQEEAARGHRIR